MNELLYICHPGRYCTQDCHDNPCKVISKEGDFPPDTCPFDGRKQKFVEGNWMRFLKECER